MTSSPAQIICKKFNLNCRKSPASTVPLPLWSNVVLDCKNASRTAGKPAAALIASVSRTAYLRSRTRQEPQPELQEVAGPHVSVAVNVEDRRWLQERQAEGEVVGGVDDRVGVTDRLRRKSSHLQEPQPGLQEASLADRSDAVEVEGIAVLRITIATDLAHEKTADTAPEAPR